MKTVIINENQKGFLFKNGKYVKTLSAGKYWLTPGKEIEISEFGHIINCLRCPLDTLLADKYFADAVALTEVFDEQLVIHFVNGRFAGAIPTHGKYAFWKGNDRHEFKTVDTSTPEVPADFPRYLFDKIQPSVYIKTEISEYEKGVLFFDNRFIRVLEPGTYYFWKNAVKVNVKVADTRLSQMDIAGQEIMTQDKVSLRINFICNYRINDFVKILTEIDNYKEQLHVAAQLALRDYVGKYKLDEILERKDEVSRYVFDALKAKESELYLSIHDAGVKDIVLPGDVRQIMNTVLIAEKTAEANVITRREEVASTRSLLNTAKLMDENQTLFRLKELEFVERIADKVGAITLNGNGDIVSQLLAVVGKPADR